MFVKKETSYILKEKVLLIQPKRRTTTYGFRSVSYFGSKLWNDHPFNTTDVSNFDDQAFRSTLHLIDEKFVSKNGGSFRSTEANALPRFYVPIPVHILLHCIYFCTQSFTRFWLMLSVFLTTLNKAILYCIVLYCVVSYRIILHCIALYCIK